MSEEQVNQSTPSTPVSSPQERITDGDNIQLTKIRAQRDIALANAKAAVSQGETAELTYNNLILQLAIKYKLTDGDVIGQDGQITRVSNSSQK